MKILLVEDDDVLRELFREIIQMEFNVECTSVGSVQGAFHEMAETQFDLIIVDYWLQGEDAGPIISMSREWYPDKPAKTLVISGDVKVRAIAESLNVDYYFNKPFDFVEFKQVIESISE